MGRLSDVLFESSRRKSPAPQDPYSSNLSPLLAILQYIYYLPIEWRKLLLDACRIQVPIRQNVHLLRSYESLPYHEFYARSDGDATIRISAEYIIALFEDLSFNPPLCSLLSYFVRAEGTYWRQDFLAEKGKSLDKELSAALHFQTADQVLDYTGLYLDGGYKNLHPQLNFVPSRLRDLYRNGLRRIKQGFSHSGSIPLLPAYSHRKNIGYASQRQYFYAVSGDYEPDGKKDVTTLDLLRFYYRSGVKTSGPLEVRQAWFYNDLKPRTYYCLGSDAFWDGLYIQEIANKFCEILPSTNPFSRFTVQRIGSISQDHILLTYDYSSFTTCLSELKFFLFWLAEEMVGTPVTVLDVFVGIKVLDLGQILHDYNNLVNHHQGFSVERFCELTENVTFHQGRSGSLGVKGNIVFSTFLHGTALAAITGKPDDDCCVGDDALAAILRTLLSISISCVNNLGFINDDKFTAIARPIPSNPATMTSDQFKFLKRPLSVDVNGSILSGVLDFFPSVADALFPEGDGIHTAAFDFDRIQSVKTFCMQWGRFLRVQKKAIVDAVSEDDLLILLRPIQAVYRKYGLPFEGAIPGDVMIVPFEKAEYKRTLEVFIPPCEGPQVFYTPWTRILLSQFYGRTLRVPITAGGTIPPPLSVVTNERFDATLGNKVISLMVDLGIVSYQGYMRETILDEDYMDDFEAFMEGRKDNEYMMAEFVVHDVPLWWYDVVSCLHPEHVPEDVEEARSRISSVFSSNKI